MPIGTIRESILASASVVGRFDTGLLAGDDSVIFTNPGAGTALTLKLAAGAAATVTGQQVMIPGTVPTQTLPLDGGVVTLAMRDLDALVLRAEDDGLSLYDSLTGAASDRVEAIALPGAAGTHVYLSPTAGSGLGIFGVDADGTLVPAGILGDTAETHLSHVTATARISTGGNDYLATASATENGVTLWQAGAGGALSAADSLAAGPAFPVAGPGALEAIEAGGRHYLVVASSVSSSLTALELGADGSLTATDQVNDTLSTRFANAGVIESFSHEGHAFLLAAGSDDGISLFTLLPGGRFVHLETLADSAARSLSNVSAMDVEKVGDTAQLLVTSGAEGGLSQFTLDLAALGDVVTDSPAAIVGSAGDDVLGSAAAGTEIDGRDGADIILDTAGGDRLSGGGGGDLFVFAPDGARDTVTDFQPGLDRLDLSPFEGIVDISQITVTPTATGATLRVAGEEIVLDTANGATIGAGALTTAELFNASHVDVTPGSPLAEIVGTPADDTLQGEAGAQALFGRDGNDLLIGGAGGDSLSGGDGLDLAGYMTATAGVTASLDDPGLNTGDAAGDLYFLIEGLRGSDFADTLEGADGSERLIGRDGDDVLRGLGGDDVLIGDSGAAAPPGMPEAGADEFHFRPEAIAPAEPEAALAAAVSPARESPGPAPAPDEPAMIMAGTPGPAATVPLTDIADADIPMFG